MKKFITLALFFALCVVGFAQEVNQVVEPSKGILASLDWSSILNIGLGVIAFVLT